LTDVKKLWEKRVPLAAAFLTDVKKPGSLSLEKKVSGKKRREKKEKVPSAKPFLLLQKRLWKKWQCRCTAKPFSVEKALGKRRERRAPGGAKHLPRTQTKPRKCFNTTSPIFFRLI